MAWANQHHSHTFINKGPYTCPYILLCVTCTPLKTSSLRPTEPARLIETKLAPAWEKQVASALALYGLSPYAPKIHKDLNSMHIVYTDDKGCLYDQPLSDLPDMGTLIDPDTGDDMEIVGYKLV